MTVLLGLTSAGVGATDFNGTPQTTAWKFTAVASGNLKVLWANTQNANAGATAVGLDIWDDSAGGARPGARLGTAAADNLATARGAGLWSATLAVTVPIVSGTVYWLSWHSSTENWDFKGDAAGAYVENAQNPVPDPWPAAGSGSGTTKAIIWGEDAPAVVPAGDPPISWGDAVLDLQFGLYPNYPDPRDSIPAAAVAPVTILPDALTHTRSTFAPTVSPQLRPAALTHTRQMFALELDTVVKPGALTHTRAIPAPTVSPQIRPGALTHTRAIYAPTVSLGAALILPGVLTHTRQMFSPTVSPQLRPGLLTHTRAIYAPNVGATLKPARLTHTRAIYAPNVVVTITPAALTHTRQMFTPKVNPQVRLSALTHTRAIYQPSVPGPPVAPGADTGSRDHIHIIGRF